MRNRLLSFLTSGKVVAPSRPCKNRALGHERLEPRELFATIPALSSLPGAAKTIHLDFDGDLQPVWNRTDRGQTYQDVFAQPPSISETDIRKIWEAVAEDFAPFKVNVTTVDPGSFANNKALKVVIAGEVSAYLITGPTSYVGLLGNTFITNDNGATLTGNSGYASINSFTNSQPNVVYVFANTLIGASTTSSEGHSRSLAAAIANTASHEAGHAFGLVHQAGVDASGSPSDYHVGDSTTTPIMGNNLAGDRTLWSNYTSGSTNYDSLARLTTALGLRADDHPSGSWFNRKLTFTNGVASINGVIEKTSDQDWFKFKTPGGNITIEVKTRELANLDVSLDVYRFEQTSAGPMATLIASIDPQVISTAPYAGLGAKFTGQLASGEYLIAIKSHGGYGDVGNYSLKVTLGLAQKAGVVLQSGARLETRSLEVARVDEISTNTSTQTNQSSSGGRSGRDDASRLAAIDALYATW